MRILPIVSIFRNNILTKTIVRFSSVSGRFQVKQRIKRDDNLIFINIFVGERGIQFRVNQEVRDATYRKRFERKFEQLTRPRPNEDRPIVLRLLSSEESVLRLTPKNGSIDVQNHGRPITVVNLKESRGSVGRRTVMVGLPHSR